MRILVCSDTHGDTSALRDVLLRQPKAEIVFHLGDGAADAAAVREAFPEKMFVQVRGNCDFGSQLPLFDEITVQGIRIFAAHGHVYQVKLGLYELTMAARDRKADVVLYGHTHAAESFYEDGLYRINPGSLKGYAASYATLDITERGLVPNLIRLS